MLLIPSVGTSVLCTNHRSLVRGPTVLPVSGMLSQCPYHTLRCSRPSFELRIHSYSSGKSACTPCIHLCSPKTVSSLLLWTSLFVSGNYRIPEGRFQACLMYFCAPRNNSCHQAECSEYFFNEAMNVSPFLVLPHNHNILI